MFKFPRPTLQLVLFQISNITPLINLPELQLHLLGLNQLDFLSGSEERNEEANAVYGHCFLSVASVLEWRKQHYNL